jgi:hypothetical protein
MFGKLAIVSIFFGFLFLSGNGAAAAGGSEADPGVALKYRLIERSVSGSRVNVRLEVSVSNGKGHPLEAVEARLIAGAPAEVAGTSYRMDEIPAETELAFEGELSYSFDSQRQEPPQLAWELSFEAADGVRRTIFVRW